ncbi:NADPH-dependent FMN reductase [Serratia plymuthica]|jgi:chromate reductase|uniref:NADPH-dependent FMN reductase n=1 Tax=Serratia plymuthica TaxID=82996 RepID=UPI0018D7B30B|nr:NADPH-dependent FMN reductase [Serratia plymuthica]QPS57611.1 NAD(P)H-dependent oxidoreductase [Serratia plymuthica]CAI1542075.1 NADPH azoreductase [Serratia plymuthica]
MSQEKPLKFVSLLGSLRKESFNAIVARNLASLAPKHVEISALGSVGEIPHYDADLQAHGFPDAVVAMGKAISAADALIIVTPEYNYSVPGALKNALDWLSRLPDTPVASKPVAILTASPGAIGGARAQYHLRQILVFLDGRVLNKPEVMIGQASSRLDHENDSITDADTRSLISAQLTALAKMTVNQA